MGFAELEHRSFPDSQDMRQRQEHLDFDGGQRSVFGNVFPRGQQFDNELCVGSIINKCRSVKKGGMGSNVHFRCLNLAEQVCFA